MAGKKGLSGRKANPFKLPAVAKGRIYDESLLSQLERDVTNLVQSVYPGLPDEIRGKLSARLVDIVGWFEAGISTGGVEQKKRGRKKKLSAQTLLSDCANAVASITDEPVRLWQRSMDASGPPETNAVTLARRIAGLVGNRLPGDLRRQIAAARPIEHPESVEMSDSQLDEATADGPLNEAKMKVFLGSLEPPHPRSNGIKVRGVGMLGEKSRSGISVAVELDSIFRTFSSHERDDPHEN